MTNKRPHIIIFNPDEMRADSLAHLGNPAAVTPHLDHLAINDGVSFGNAYCQNPVCVPSRCSFFTGLYPHVNGHRTMSYLLRPGETTLLQELKQSGYHVWINARNDLTASQYAGWSAEHASEIYYGGKSMSAPRPKRPVAHDYSHYSGQLETDDEDLNYSGDDEDVDAACTRILDWQPGDKPLCIFLGLLAPHPPYAVEDPYFSAIERGRLLPRIRPEDCSGKPRMETLIRNLQQMDHYNEADWQELRAVYQGMCTKVDEQFGRLSAALKQAGIYDDSAIFVFSDHGDYIGDYGLVEKAQNCFEDCLTRVPFLIKPPEGFPLDSGISDSLVELVDFYATAMDFAGVTPAHTHFGISLRGVLADRSRMHRQYAFCEGGRMPGEQHCDEYHNEKGEGASERDAYWPKKMAQLDDEAHAKGIMIRDRRFKYISRSLGTDELYDLDKDPNETQNRIDDPSLSDQIGRLQQAMLKWLQATADIVPYDFDRRFDDEKLWAMVGRMVPPEHESAVRSRIRDGIGIGDLFVYVRGLKAGSRSD